MPASESVLGLDNTPQVREAAETTGNKLPNPEQNHLTDAGKASKEQGNRHPTKPTAVAAPMMQVGKSLAIPSSTSTTQEFNTSAAPSTPLTVGRTFPQNSSADMLALVQNPALLAATAATQDNGSFVQQQQMILEAQLALAHEQRKARDALAQQLMEQEQQRQQQLLLMSLNQHQASQLLANSAFSVPKSVNSNRQLNAEAPEQSQHQIQEQLSRIQQATDVANAISLLQAKTTGQPQAQPSKPVSGPMPTGSPIAQPAAVSQAHAPLGINGSNSLMESLILLGNPGMARMIEAEGLKVSPEMLLTASLASQLPLASVASGPQQLYQQLVSSAQHRMMSSSEINTGHIYDEDHASKRRRTEAAELQAPQPSHMLGLQRANTPAQLQALLHSQDGSQLLSKALANMKGTNPHIHQGVPSPQTPHALSPTDKKRKTGMVAPAPLIIHVPSKDGKPTGRKMPASGKNKAEEQRVRGSKSSEPAESAVKGRTWWPRRTELCFRDITKLENPPKLSQTSTLRGIYYRSNGRYKADIQVCGRSVFLGNYASKELACQAYDRMAIKVHGEDPEGWPLSQRLHFPIEWYKEDFAYISKTSLEQLIKDIREDAKIFKLHSKYSPEVIKLYVSHAKRVNGSESSAGQYTSPASSPPSPPTPVAKQSPEEASKQPSPESVSKAATPSSPPEKDQPTLSAEDTAVKTVVQEEDKKAASGETFPQPSSPPKPTLAQNEEAAAAKPALISAQ